MADEHVLSASAAGERFELTWHRVSERGWLHALPHRADGLGLNADQPAALDRVATGDRLPLARLDLAESWTVPPDPLREAELVRVRVRVRVRGRASS